MSGIGDVGDDFEVVGGYGQGAVRAAVALVGKGGELAAERLPAGVVEGGPRLDGRSVVRLERLEEIVRRAVPEDELTTNRVHLRGVPEQFTETVLGAPLQRRRNALGRRDMGADDLEHAPD